ncbi:MAG: GIY-YIG nuclease family protein [Candidatus Jordarchaeum sp.]|uniref:GIY-YIG nuclease family protein n=1 Tax=Candidatus Jordarchaeum sp. TaxID=2823881 RepID=UPI004049198C
MIDYSYAETGNSSNLVSPFYNKFEKFVTKMFLRAGQKGVYSLLIEIQVESQIPIGKLGRISFPAGFYVYTGSALGNGASSLKGRLLRHLSSKKKNFWHIDYFLSGESSSVIGVVFAETTENKEHDVVRALKPNLKIVCEKFGASDCNKKCVSHLLYLGKNQSKNIELIKQIYEKLGLKPTTIILKKNGIN